MVQFKLSEINRDVIARSHGLVHFLNEDGTRLASFMRCDPAEVEERIMGLTREEADRIIREEPFYSSEDLMEMIRRYEP